MLNSTPRTRLVMCKILKNISNYLHKMAPVKMFKMPSVLCLINKTNNSASLYNSYSNVSDHCR